MTDINRREFLKVGGATAAVGVTALLVDQVQLPNPNVKPAGTSTTGEHIVKTACGMCPSGCGLEVRVVDGRAVKVEGDPLHPLNQGICCLKGQTSLEVLYSPERIQHPRIQLGERGGGDWKEISWDEALTFLAEKLDKLRKSGLPHSVAMMHGELRGQMRMLITRWMQSYGSPNLIGRESLGEQVVRQAVFLSQGVNGLPVYDLNNANYAISFGGNPLEAGRNVIANLGAVAFMRRGRPQRGKLVVVNPRASLSGLKADEWIPIRPASYAAFALGMANVIINSGLYDKHFVEHFTFGFEDFRDSRGRQHKGFKSLVLEQYTLEKAAHITGVPAEIIARIAGEFATNRPAVAMLPTEAGEYTAGNALYTALAVHALNSLVGAIDIKGGVLTQRFPELSGWPEVTLDETAQVGLEKPRIDEAGTSSYPLARSLYQNFANQVNSSPAYPVNLLVLLNANPVYDVPNQGEFVRAMNNIPFVVSFAATLDESAAHADMVLPVSTFLETWGDDYLEGTGYAGLSLRRPVVEPLNDSRNPGDILLKLAHILGEPMRSALHYDSYLDLIKARVNGSSIHWETLEKNGSWAEMIYVHARPGSAAWGNVMGRDRLNAPKDGRFDLFSRELFALLGDGDDLACLPHFAQPAGDETPETAAEYPFQLILQALITESTQWQGIVPTLQEAYGLQNNVKWQSWVEINPTAAHNMGIKDGDRVYVESESGRVEAVARLYAGLWPNVIFMPGGQGHFSRVRWGRGAQAGAAIGSNQNQLIATLSELICGQAVQSPQRVRIVKV